MREKKRYLLIASGINEIQKSILDFSGVLGMAKTGLKFIKKNNDSGIISINRESLNLVRASFSVWPRNIKVKKVSGTIKGLGV